MRVLHAFDLLALSGDLPHGAAGVDLRPTSKPKLTGPDEDQKGELGGQPGQRATGVAVDSLKQLRQTIQRQRRPVDSLACGGCTLKVHRWVGVDVPVLDSHTHDPSHVLP
ncbi:hypothetical protein D3C76_1585060 [compost metagenome]